MFTLLFLISVIVALPVLILIQPAERRTFFEPGVLIVGLFALCYLAPALATLLDENISPAANEDTIEVVSQYGFLFVVSFVFFYAYLSGMSRWRIFPAGDINISGHPKTYLFGVVLFFAMEKMITGYYGVGDAANYGQQYVIRASMPSAINQFIVLLQSVQWMFIYLLLASCLAAFRFKYAKFLLGLAFLMPFVDMWLTNSRSSFVTFTIVFIAAYTFYRPPIGIKKEVFFSALFVVIMGLFAYRRLGSGVEIGIGLSDIFLPGEFVSVFGNAIHWASMCGTEDFSSPPGNSYLQALVSFVPKQFNEGKWDLASWYVWTYFPGYAEVGGGLAFGMVPEAMVNWGLASIVFQAFVIAVIFRIAYFSAYRNRGASGNIWVVFYLFSYAQIYQLIRSHSFSIISGLVIGFIVPYITLLILSRIRVTSTRCSHA